VSCFLMVRRGHLPYHLLTPRYLLIRLNRPNTYHAAIQEADFLIEGLLRFLRDAYDKDVGAPPPSPRRVPFGRGKGSIHLGIIGFFSCAM